MSDLIICYAGVRLLLAAFIAATFAWEAVSAQCNRTWSDRASPERTTNHKHRLKLSIKRRIMSKQQSAQVAQSTKNTRTICARKVGNEWARAQTTNKNSAASKTCTASRSMSFWAFITRSSSRSILVLSFFSSCAGSYRVKVGIEYHLSYVLRLFYCSQPS